MVSGHLATRDTPCGVPALGTLAMLAALALLPADAATQARATASLGGIVVESGTGRPLIGATVSLLGVPGRETTDAEGRFLLYDVPSGRQRISISYRGHDAPGSVIELAPAKHTDVRIALALTDGLPPREEDVVPLPPLDIDIPRPDPPGKLRPFYRRLEAGRGSFITRDQIVARDPSQMTDMLREVAGIRVSGSSSFGTGISTVRGCGLQVFIDGLPAPGFQVDDMPPQDIAGVEIYLGPAETPIQFRRSGECGTLVIWTRDPGDPA